MAKADADIPTRASDPEIKQRLIDLIRAAGSQRKAAKMLNYSAAVLNLYLSDSYTGNIEQFERAVRTAFELREASQKLYSSQVISTDYVKTSVSEAVYSVIRICHLKGGLSIACGDAGIGKTMACKQYADDYPSVVYLTVNPCVATPRSFLRLLCRTLRIPEGCKDDMWLRVRDYFGSTQNVMIIDEAQHLPIRTIDMIRAFYDADPNLGICLVGNLETVTSSGRTREAFAQIRNRTKITEIHHTFEITYKDIQQLFKSVDDAESLKLLHMIAQSEQGIRGAVNVYSNALDNNDTSLAGLRAIAQGMHLYL